MNDELIGKTAELLKMLEPCFLPYPIFEQVARLIALPIIEFIPFKKTDEGIKVLLLRRPENDPIWPNELHTPGTVIRATDIGIGESIWRPFERILNDELLGTHVSKPHFVGSIMHQSRRGTEQAQIYWLEILDDPKIGELHSLDHLPKEFLESQRNFVFQAAESFKRSRAN